MAIYKLGDSAPVIHESVFVADTATIIGQVRLEKHVSIWYGAVLRADNDRIVVGAGSNVQDGAVLHTDSGFALCVGERVTIGHQVMLHGCTIGAGSLVGIQAIILNGAVVGRNCLVGAGALITEGKTFPDNTLILGSPARAIRTLSEDDIARLASGASSYVERRQTYKESLVRIG